VSRSEAASPYLRVRKVMARYRRSRSTIYLWMETSGFPRPVKVGPRVVVWRLADLEAWERGDDERVRNGSEVATL
jgi:predicted DNA-binding transcriptional regulator AlpA